MFNLLPWILGLTSLINYGHRQGAQNELESVMNEDIVTPAQARGSVIQGFADRGLNIGINSPAVQETLRRQSLAKRQQKAQLKYQQVAGGPDPLATLFGIFSDF